jgi:hypothetical protein
VDEVFLEAVDARRVGVAAFLADFFLAVCGIDERFKWFVIHVKFICQPFSA